MIGISPALKDKAILLGWIIGLVLVAALLWSLTFSFRAGGLMRSVNKVLAAAGDERVLSAPLERPFSGSLPMGCWFTLDRSDSLFYVFAIMKDGILIPCGAEISPSGGPAEIIPLGVNSRRLMERTSAGLVRIYARRIEAVVAEGRTDE